MLCVCGCVCNVDVGRYCVGTTASSTSSEVLTAQNLHVVIGFAKVSGKVSFEVMVAQCRDDIVSD